MVKFNGTNNDTLKLTLLGFETYKSDNPNRIFTENDWLSIRVELQTKHGYIDHIFGAYLYYEFEWLIDWISDISDHKPIINSVPFSEPLLRFEKDFYNNDNFIYFYYGHLIKNEDFYDEFLETDNYTMIFNWTPEEFKVIIEGLKIEFEKVSLNKKD